MQYYLGMDNGGTVTKAAVYDGNGHEIAVSSSMTRTITPKPGWVERDMEEMWQSNCLAVKDVLKKSGLRPDQISCVAVCGHGKGLYLWGKDNCPVRNGILSMDNRACRYPSVWSENGIVDELFPVTLQHILACQPVSLLAWLRDHEPETAEKTAWIFGAKDYIRFRLTGEAGAEITDCSGSGLMDLNSKSYSDTVLEKLELSEFTQALPRIVGSTEICGAVTKEAAEECGLMAGTPVIGGMFDINACALSVDVTDEESLCMIAGTWSINEYLSKKPVLDGSILMNSLFVMPEYYLIEESSPTSAGNNEWFIQTLLPELKKDIEESGKKVYDLVNQWVEEIPAEEICPIFLPFLMGSNRHPYAKGSFVGINSSHTRKHLARSVYEGITFCHQAHLDKLLKSRESVPKKIRLAGGAARSAVWAQMFADVSGIPVETVDVTETGTLGCAIAAAAAMGEYPDIKAAAKAMCGKVRRYEPRDDKRECYQRKYRMYDCVARALDSVWDEYQLLTENTSLLEKTF